jgi:hypothetical protein
VVIEASSFYFARYYDCCDSLRCKFLHHFDGVLRLFDTNSSLHHSKFECEAFSRLGVSRLSRFKCIPKHHEAWHQIFACLIYFTHMCLDLFWPLGSLTSFLVNLQADPLQSTRPHICRRLLYCATHLFVLLGVPHHAYITQLHCIGCWHCLMGRSLLSTGFFCVWVMCMYEMRCACNTSVDIISILYFNWRLSAPMHRWAR